MNNDSHLLFEAYLRSRDLGITEADHIQSTSTEEASQEEYHGVAKSHKHSNPESTHSAIIDHMKKIYGDKFDETKAHKAASKATGKVDEQDEQSCAAANDGCDCDGCPDCKANQDDHEPVTEASKHTKKHVFKKVEKAAEKAGYSKKAAERIAGAAKAKALKKEK